MQPLEYVFIWDKSSSKWISRLCLWFSNYLIFINICKINLINSFVLNLPTLLLPRTIIKHTLLIELSIIRVHVWFLIWLIFFKLISVSIAIVVLLYLFTLTVVIFSRFFKVLKVVVILIVVFHILFHIILVTKSPFHVIISWVEVPLILEIFFVCLFVCLWLVFKLILASEWLPESFLIVRLFIRFRLMGIFWLLVGWVFSWIIVSIVFLKVVFTCKISVKVIRSLLIWLFISKWLIIIFIFHLHHYLTIVLCSFRFILQRWVGWSDLFKNLIILRSDIWMIFLSKYKIFFLYLILCCVFTNTKYLVKVSGRKLS